MQIRLINENELPYLYLLRNEVLRKPLGLSIYTTDFSLEKDFIKIGAFLNNKMVGCVMLSILNDTTIKLKQMAVQQELQGIGIGTRLILFALEWCVENNYSIVELSARKTAMLFYKKFNFKIIGNEFLEVGIAHYKMIKKIK